MNSLAPPAAKEVDFTLTEDDLTEAAGVAKVMESQGPPYSCPLAMKTDRMPTKVD